MSGLACHYKVPLGGGNTETTVVVYDAGGKLVAEYSTTVASQSTAQVSYLTNDHLGSPRITTDKNGKVFSRRDFLPFGEDLDINVTAERTSAIGYGSDSVRQKFTGYERDDETATDFAEARVYDYTIGRFRSADPVLIEKMRLYDPKGLNLYLYVQNNPLKYVDPSGEEYVGADEKKVTYKLIDGEIIVENGKETGSLRKLREAINKSGSPTAAARFMALNDNRTRITVRLGEGQLLGKKNAGYHFVHDKEGNLLDMDDPKQRTKAAFTEDGKEYAAATISIDLDAIASKEYLNPLRESWGLDWGITDEIIATFAHESVHDTDPNQVAAVLQSKKNSGEIPNADNIFHPSRPKDSENRYPPGSPSRVANDVRREIRRARDQ